MSEILNAEKKLMDDDFNEALATMNLPEFSERENEQNAEKKLLDDDYNEALATINLTEFSERVNAQNVNEDLATVLLPENNIQYQQKNTMNRFKWTKLVRNRIDLVGQKDFIAKNYLNNHFFCFELWPPYLVELFVRNCIADFSYVLRNKICIFFWGNGATFETMQVLSSYYSIQTKKQDLRSYEKSCHKCVALFKMYTDKRFDYDFSHKYYYYNVNKQIMVYVDGTVRSVGERQENSYYNNFPIWY